MDPVTVIAAATAAWKGLRTAVNAGKEIQSMMGDVAGLYKSVEDLGTLHKKKKKKFGKSAEKEALEIWAARQEAKDRLDSIRQLIIDTRGFQAWQEVQALMRQVRNDRAKAEAARKKLIQQRIQKFQIAGAIFLLIVVLIGVIGFFGWLFIFKRTL
jgi:hypothetical protein